MQLANNLEILGKCLDQPALVKKLYNAVPYALSGSAAGYGLYDVYKAPEKERKNRFIQDFCILSLTVASALVATRGLKIHGKQIFEGLIELPHAHGHGHGHTHEDKVLDKVFDAKLKPLIDKIKKGDILGLSDIKTLKNGLEKDVLDDLIPAPHNHSPFEELGKLSLLGLIPVIGGVTGGILGDKLTSEDWKKKLPDKIKEGSYQYLNNIFLCNVGAGIAMVLMNKLNVQSRITRFFAMMTGVIGVGLIAGSAIANFIGKNYINPIFDKNTPAPEYPDTFSMIKDLNKERHPELLDLSLHIDDIASVGFLSGLKWIGPVLPMLYSVSAYRAGIGYRNGIEQQEKPNYFGGTPEINTVNSALFKDFRGTREITKLHCYEKLHCQ